VATVATHVHVYQPPKIDKNANDPGVLMAELRRQQDAGETYRTVPLSGWGVTLDGKLLKRPDMFPLVMPNEGLAMAVAAEWESQRDYVRPPLMPLTGLAGTAMMLSDEACQKTRNNAMRYLDGDTICYQQSPSGPNRALHDLQRKTWDPLIRWFETSYGVMLSVTTGYDSVFHDENTLHCIAKVDKSRVAHVERCVISALWW